MLGVTGDLLGRVQDKIEVEFGRWCGVTLLGKDGRSILVLTVYNVSQKIESGIGDTKYYKQFQNQHLLQYNRLKHKYNKKADRIDPTKFLNPRIRFYEDLTKFIRKHLVDKKDIILTG